MNPRDEPPPLRLYGKAIPFWLNGHRFVIESIDWTPRDQPRLLGPQDRIRRAAVTITFLQHVDEGYYRIRKRKKKKGGKGKGGKGDGKDSGPKRLIVREGDDAIQIAARMYGDPTMWKVIAEANGFRNPRKLTPGDELVIPNA